MRICECAHALIEHPNDECSRCDCKAYRDDSGPTWVDPISDVYEYEWPAAAPKPLAPTYPIPAGLVFNWQGSYAKNLEWAVRHIENEEPKRALTCLNQAIEALECGINQEHSQ